MQRRTEASKKFPAEIWLAMQWNAKTIILLRRKYTANFKLYSKNIPNF